MPDSVPKFVYLIFILICTVQYTASNRANTALNIPDDIIFEDHTNDEGLKLLDTCLDNETSSTSCQELSRSKRLVGILLDTAERIVGRARTGVRKVASWIFPGFVGTDDNIHKNGNKDILEHVRAGLGYQRNDKKKILEVETNVDVSKTNISEHKHPGHGFQKNYKKYTVESEANTGVGNKDIAENQKLGHGFQKSDNKNVIGHEREIARGEKDDSQHQSADNGVDQKSDIETKDPVRDNAEKTTQNQITLTSDATINKEPNTSNAAINKTLITPNTTQSKDLIQDFKESVYRMEYKFYQATFQKIIELTKAEARKEVGFSFVQSTLCLHMVLMLMAPEFTPEARQQLERAANFSATEKEQYYILKTMMARIPNSNSGLIIRWAAHLLVRSDELVSRDFRSRARDTVGMDVVSIAEDNNEQIVSKMNQMVERDTSGALHESFYPDDVEGEVETLLNIAVYFRPDFRGTVTVLNKEMDFKDAPTGPFVLQPMFRVNDIIGYSKIAAWDAEVLDIPYATSNLSLVVVAPRSPLDMKSLAERVPGMNVDTLVRRLPRKRMEVTMPIFTLRMTTVLSNKLEQMGMPAIIKNSTSPEAKGPDSKEGLQLTHATQRFMFWSQSGINAYKEDGQDWDPKPELSVVMDHPYIFMVKYNDAVIMSGNWVGL